VEVDECRGEVCTYALSRARVIPPANQSGLPVGG
jgi:hypothetical protein